MKTVIMAGGRGTRISSVFPNIPKPMIPVMGMPVLEREIGCLRSQGFTDIIITVNHLASVIMEHFGDGRDFGVNIEYFCEETPLGNAGALFQLKDRLTEDFLLLNADAVFDVNFKRFVDFHRNHRGLVTLFTHPNSHPYDSGLIIADNDCCVEKWLTKEDARPQWYKNRVNAGLHILSKKLLQQKFSNPKIDLDRQLLKPLSGTGKMYCYDSPEYVKDMGTPERYESVCDDYKNGIVAAKNLNNKQKAIFLDRDGTINKYKGFLNKIEDFELLPDVAEAIGQINSSSYLAIVVTNQPVVARGETTEEELDEIHKKMETLLGQKGAYIDALYYCPHHPDSGFQGERRELKFDCDCRKPKPGMLLRAAKEYGIDLSQSWMIGDSESDMIAGTRAGCKCLRLEESVSLYDAIKKILEN